ncbi:MAG: hypothetical protein ACKV2V_27730 [Blastocatellia bacterium]
MSHHSLLSPRDGVDVDAPVPADDADPEEYEDATPHRRPIGLLSVTRALSDKWRQVNKPAEPPPVAPPHQPPAAVNDHYLASLLQSPAGTPALSEDTLESEIWRVVLRRLEANLDVCRHTSRELSAMLAIHDDPRKTRH